MPSFFEHLGERRYLATSATVGPWDPRLAHGSPPAALLVREIERQSPRDDVRVARITFDFFGPVAVGEIELSGEMVRPGARIDLSRARISVSGRVAMEASAWRISASPGRVPEVRDERSAPPLPAAQPQRSFGDVPSFGYGESLEWRFFEGAFDALGPAAAYARPRIELIEGEPVTPLGRLLLMVDSANGISAALPPSQFTFVPVELTVSVWRHPRTEWVGMRAATTIDGDGIGQTKAELFDEQGYVGTAVQTLFVAKR